ncbi:MAG: trigger factor [Planctomycetes bacterium]|nr:trigger factor [Planctomycetota bacterium]
MSEEPSDDAAQAGGVAIGEKAGLSITARFEDVGPCKKKVAVEVAAEDVNRSIREGVLELQRGAMLPGFRRGHAPLALVEKRFGTDLRKDVKSRLVADGYRQALEENGARPITDPDIDVDSIEMADGEPLKFEVTVEVWPEFEVTGYEGLKLERQSTQPTTEEVEAEIGNLRMRTTSLEEVEGEPAKEDHLVLCDYSIKSAEEELADAKDVAVRPVDEMVGAYKVPGIKKALTGKNVGESVKIEFKVDKKHPQEDIRGREAVLVLDVKAVRRPNIPEVDDDWAKGLGFKSLDELITVVGRNVQAAKENAADSDLRLQVHNKLLEMMQFDLPEGAVSRQQKDIIAKEQMGLRYRGATEEDLAKISDKLEETSLEKAERDLKILFIISRIAEKENVHASDADVDMRIAELATRYRTTTAKMHQQLEREGMLPEIALEVREEKTIAHILSTAEITEAPAPEKPEKPEKKEGAKPKKEGAKEPKSGKAKAGKATSEKKTTKKEKPAKTAAAKKTKQDAKAGKGDE